MSPYRTLRLACLLEPLEARRLLSTFIVDSAEDIDDGLYGTGQLSFREAVSLANQLAGEDTVRFAASLSGVQLDADILITDDLVIERRNEQDQNINFFLYSEKTSRKLLIDDGDKDTSIRVTINGMNTFYRKNYTTWDTVPTIIFSQENLVLLNSSFLAEGFSSASGVRHTGTTPDAFLVVRNSIFRGNRSASATDSDSAVYSTGAASVTIESSEFSVNERGAISIVNAEEVSILNTTIASNTSSQKAGGVYLDLPGGRATISNSTIVSNTVTGNSGPKAGGVYIVAGTLRLNSTIMASNLFNTDSAEMLLGPDAVLDFPGSRNNLILDEATAGGLWNGLNGNILGVSPKLGPLTDNGGPTQTRAPREGSLAIDAGNNDLGLETDQRGGLFRRAERIPDIGAYESVALTIRVDSVANTDDDGEYSTGNLTLREAVAISNSTPEVDTIVFDDSLVGATISVDPMSITKEVRIEGLGSDKLKLRASGTGRLFSLGVWGEESFNVTITDLWLTNSGNSSAISGNAKLILHRVKITDNSTASDGAAVAITGSLTIIDSAFADNTSLGDGGALWVDGELTISGSTFTNNSAGGAGGAIWTNQSTTITESTFTGNTAGTDGGAVLADEISGFINHKISGSIFTNNTAERNGGAIVGRGLFTTSTFTGNAAGDNGGAIYSLRLFRDIVFSSLIFTANTAGNEGGALWGREFVLLNSTFERNWATTGGAVWAIDTFSGSQLRFQDNQATGNGGAIAYDGRFWVRLDNSSLLNNVAGGDGGALYTTGQPEITRSTLTANSASRGGAIFNTGTLRIDQSTLANNTADTDGGALWTSGNLTIENSTISANGAAGFGGGIAIAGGTTTLRFSTIASNRADTDNTGQESGAGIHVGTQTGEGLLITHDSLYADNLIGLVHQTFGISGNGEVSAQSSSNLVDSVINAGGLLDGILFNIVGVDPKLGPLADNGGPTQTYALESDSPAINAGKGAVSTDQRGIRRPVNNAPDIGAYEWGALAAREGTSINVTSSTDDTLDIVMWSLEGNWIVFRGQGEEWSADYLGLDSGSPKPIGNALTWTNPADGRLRIGGPTDAGFLLYTRNTDNTWSQQNISVELDVVTDSPIRALTRLTTRAGLVLIAGYNASDEIVAFRQIVTNGKITWSFVNISEELVSQNMTTPDLTELVGYTTPWDAWNLAGVDAAGDIQVVWVHPSSFSAWRVDNLSDITGAPPIVGRLTVTQTRWKAINLGGLDAAGQLMVTWWVPGAAWTTSNLTVAANGPKLVDGNITGFVTPWGAINYVGIDSTGTIVAFWWTPQTNWIVSNLRDSSSGLTGTLSSHVSAAGTLNIFGTKDNGEVLRLWWMPSDDNGWQLSNLSELAG